jgi:hypothetical protein
MTATLGYARVSTTGQDLGSQLAALGAAGVDPGRVFTDTLSGSANTARPGLAAMLDYARPEDTLVVSAIDRLGRSVAEVTRTIADLGARRILLRAYAKESIPPPRQGVRSRRSWPPSLSSNSNSAVSAAHPANPAGPEVCRPPSRPDSAPNAKSSCAALPPPVNPCASSLKRSESDELLRTVTYRRRSSRLPGRDFRTGSIGPGRC